MIQRGHAVPVQLDVAMTCPRWREALPRAAALARRAARAALDEAAPGIGAAEVSLVLADDATLARLNREYRGVRGATNVLSFPSADRRARTGESPMLGDVVLAFETCAGEAKDRGIPLADHLAHLVVHGVLHLLGHDHEKDAEAVRMEALETAALGRLGIEDPYQRLENVR